MKYLPVLLVALLVLFCLEASPLRRRTLSKRKTLFNPNIRAGDSASVSVFYNPQTDEYITTNSITKQSPTPGYYAAAWATFDNTIQTSL